jgi:hypothetical protein
MYMKMPIETGRKTGVKPVFPIVPFSNGTDVVLTDSKGFYTLPVMTVILSS